MKLPRTLALALALICVPRVVGAADDRVACVLVGAYGAPARLAVARQGTRFQPATYLLLRVGDELIVEDAESRLVARCGGREVVVTRAESPFVVSYEGAPPDLLENLLAWAREFLGGGVAAPGSTASVAVRGEEDEPLAIPMLKDRSVFTGAGRREIALGWYGGRPPFGLRLYDITHRLQIASEPLLGEREAILSARAALAEGSYEVEVVDATGVYAREGFEVVLGEKLPRPPKALSGATRSDPIRATLRATWIASIDEGSFVLEGYQQAAALGPSHQPARLLQQKLRAGGVPPRPPE